MADKIDKIIARLQERIAEGEYYEAHQQTRVVVARHVKACNWLAAINVLFAVSMAMLKARQGGSGGDLAIYLIDVYVQSKTEVDVLTRHRVKSCLRAFPPDEPTRKTFINDAIAWSSKFGPYRCGDPELHHEVGELYAQECEPYDAERHFLLGTFESPEAMARMEVMWSLQEKPRRAALYAARGIFAYLLLADVNSANVFYCAFVRILVQESSRRSGKRRILAHEYVGKRTSFFCVPRSPLLNFLGLMLLTIPTRRGEAFYTLLKRYQVRLTREAPPDPWQTCLSRIGEMYFGIRPPAKYQPRPQANPVLDMAGNMMGGAA